MTATAPPETPTANRTRPSEIAVTNCGHCHTCGATLVRPIKLSDSQRCPWCQTVLRYRSHGYPDGTGPNTCSAPAIVCFPEDSVYCRDALKLWAFARTACGEFSRRGDSASRHAMQDALTSFDAHVDACTGLELLGP